MKESIAYLLRSKTTGLYFNGTDFSAKDMLGAKMLSERPNRAALEAAWPFSEIVKITLESESPLVRVKDAEPEYPHASPTKFPPHSWLRRDTLAYLMRFWTKAEIDAAFERADVRIDPYRIAGCTAGMNNLTEIIGFPSRIEAEHYCEPHPSTGQREICGTGEYYKHYSDSKVLDGNRVQLGGCHRIPCATYVREVGFRHTRYAEAELLRQLIVDTFPWAIGLSGMWPNEFSSWNRSGRDMHEPEAYISTELAGENGGVESIYLPVVALFASGGWDLVKRRVESYWKLYLRLDVNPSGIDGKNTLARYQHHVAVLETETAKMIHANIESREHAENPVVARYLSSNE